jgi:hypothetical protein
MTPPPYRFSRWALGVALVLLWAGLIVWGAWRDVFVDCLLVLATAFWFLAYGQSRGRGGGRV